MHVVGDDRDLLVLASDFSSTVNRDLLYSHYSSKPLDKFELLRVLSDERENTVLKDMVAFVARHVRSKAEAQSIKGLVAPIRQANEDRL